MTVFATKQAELCAYMEHNGWGLPEVVAMNMLKQKSFRPEEAAQIMLVARRTGRRYEDVMSVVIMAKAAHHISNLRKAMGKM